MILDATTILLNIYISLIGLFYFWFSLVLLLISGWGPWLMFHHGDWGGGGGSFWSSSIWMDRKFFRHSYSSGIFFSRLLRMILGFIPISLTQETKPFRNLILSLEGILSCTIIPRLRNVLFSSWAAFCFCHRHDEKHKAPHSPKVALIFLSPCKVSLHVLALSKLSFAFGFCRMCPYFDHSLTLRLLPYP